MLQQYFYRLLPRRDFLKVGLGTTASVAGASVFERVAGTGRGGAGNDLSAVDLLDTPASICRTDVASSARSALAQADATGAMDSHAHGNSMLVGAVDHTANGFDPMQLLVDWDYGQVSMLPNGQRLREYFIVAADKEIEIAPGIHFPAWTYNGRVPGPTLRCTEGDRIRILFHNGGSHPHTMHFHGVHPAEMDGATGIGVGDIAPGQQFTYEFDAEPFGCHLYHCHATPLKRHIHKGLYGAFIVDPKGGRPPAREFMMMMNAFDTNFDNENEVYAVNTVGHEFARRPIPIQVGERVRIYLINITEFDPINSLHIHAEFFDYYDHGTTLEPTQRTVDTIMQCQAQRGLVEFRYRWPGLYMFHAHQSEFAELGWMGFFKAVPPENWAAALAEAGVDSTWDLRGAQGATAAAESWEVVL